VKHTVVCFELAISEINTIRSFPDLGINPIKRKLLKSNPDKVNATITLEGPGIDSIFTFLLTSAAINSEPGSEIRGVPASDNNAIFLPSANKLSISESYYAHCLENKNGQVFLYQDDLEVL